MSNNRLARVLCAVVLALVAGPGLAVAQYACSMSGEVSSSCCCAPKSDEGCPSIQRACACCDVSYVSSGIDSDQPATAPGFSTNTISHQSLVITAVVAIVAPAYNIRPVHRAEFAPSPPLGLYLLNSSLRR